MDVWDPASVDAICQLKARYFRLLDQQRWAELVDVFCPDVVVNVTADRGSDSPIVGRDAFVDLVARQLAGATTVHHGHMPEITIDSDATAHAVWSMTDQIWFPDGGPVRHLSGCGWYHEKYRRNAGGWQIAEMVLRRQRVEIDGVVVVPGPRPDTTGSQKV